MSAWLITLLLLFGASLQTLLPTELPLVLSLLIIIAIQSDRAHNLYAAMLAGLLYDSLCPAPLGISIPYFVLTAEGIRMIRNEVFGDQLITYIILGALLTVFKEFYLALVFSMGGLRTMSAGRFLLHTAGNGLAGAVLCPLIYLIIARFQHLFHLRRRRIL